jgi:hypothetical protein
MNLKSLIVFFVFLYFSCSLEGQDITNQVNYGGAGFDVAIGNCLYKDNLYFVGTTSSQDHDISINRGKYDLWLFKTDLDGSLIWSKTFGGSETERGYSVCAKDDYLYITGYTESDIGQNPARGTDLYLLKTDLVGKLIWERTLRGNEYDKGIDLFIYHNEIYLLGSSNSNDTLFSENIGSDDAYLFKIDTSGEIYWQKNYGGSKYESFIFHKIYNDKIYLIGASSSSDGDLSKNHGSSDAWMVGLDSKGDIIFSKTIGGSDRDVFADMTIINDTFFFLINTNSNDGDIGKNYGGDDIVLFKLDQNGNIISKKTYQGTNDESAFYFLPPDNNQLKIAGYSNSNDGVFTGNLNSFDDFVIFDLDLDGNTKEINRYGGSMDEWYYNVYFELDNRYLFVVNSTSFDYDVNNNLGGMDAWLFFINKTSGINENNQLDGIKLTPNPFQSHLSLRLDSENNKYLYFKLYDSKGRQVYSSSNISSKSVFELSHLSKGIYIYIIGDTENEISGRVIKQ